jgi:hypothetical protein
MNHRWFLPYLIVLFLLLPVRFFPAAVAQGANSAVSDLKAKDFTRPFQETMNEMSKASDIRKDNRTGNPLLPALPEDIKSDNKTREKYLETFRAYYEYRLQGYKQRMQAFEWQALSSKIIFVFVLMLVFIGIGFAAVQFYIGLPKINPNSLIANEAVTSKAGDEPEKRQDKEVSQIEISLQGVKLSSPILGVIILIISLAFFYLYLVYVYPLNDTF